MSCSSAFAQKVIKHKVKSGESIYSIARKYDVTENQIYEMNPKLKGAVLALKAEVNIPNRKYIKDEKLPKEPKKEVLVSAPISISNEPFILHLVVAKETLYSLSKKYSVAMETICEMNPELKTGNLKVGTRLQFPNLNKSSLPEPTKEISSAKQVVTADEASTNSQMHLVLPKETLYRISKKYGVTVSQLQEWNPRIASGLPIGYNLIVKKGTLDPIVSSNLALAETPKAVVDELHFFENLSKADFLIAKASQHIGTRYRGGGTSSDGFDCSGLMCATFGEIEMSLPRTSGEQSNHGLTIDISQAQKGDLIFFSTSGRGRINHVGMVTEIVHDEIKFIHSSIQAGVIISSTKEAYYAKRFVKVNRVLLDN